MGGWHKDRTHFKESHRLCLKCSWSEMIGAEREKRIANGRLRKFGGDAKNEEVYNHPLQNRSKDIREKDIQLCSR